MITSTRLRLVFLLSIVLAALAPTMVNGQKGAPALAWTHEITVVPTTITYQDSTVQAFSFTVYETTEKNLLELWRADHSARSTVIMKGDPLAAKGAVIEKLSAAPLTMLARVKGDKKAGAATLTVAFLPQAPASLAATEVQKEYVHGLAVRYNRSVVEAQIQEQEKAMAKTSGKLSKSVSQDEKLKKDLNKTQAELNKLQATRMKEQTRNARLQGDVVGAERTYGLSNDVKDLKKLTKVRGKLADGETKVARLMEKEAKLQSAATKVSADLPSAARAREENTAAMSKHQEILEALRTKMSDIR